MYAILMGESYRVMNHTVKVLVTNRPDALRTWLEELLQHQSDIEVVGTVLDPIELLIAIEDTQADVAVVDLPDSGEMPGICSHVFHEYPQFLILALSSDHMRACVYRQVITEAQLPNTSNEVILTASRQAKADSTS